MMVFLNYSINSAQKKSKWSLPLEESWVPGWWNYGPDAWRKTTTENATEAHWERVVSLFSRFLSLFLKSVSELSADAEVPHGKLFPFINNECVAGPMKQSRFNKPRGALSRRNVLNAFLQALQPDWLSNVILSKARRNKSIPRSLLLYARRFSLSGCARQVAYTSYRFLSVNRFQGEHRWAQPRTTMQCEERHCANGARSQLITAAAAMHLLKHAWAA